MDALNWDRTRQLALAPHVHACSRGQQVILLDLQRDKYLAVGGMQMQLLSAGVRGWPQSAEVRDAPPAVAEVRRVAKHLLSQGLLIEGTQGVHPRLPDIELPEAVSTLTDEGASPEFVNFRRVFSFLTSAASAAAWLRCRSLLAVVRSVAVRASAGRKSVRIPLEQARSAVAAYEWLRPLVFTSRDACLFDSLALFNFLAFEGMFPHLVIGVRTDPFAAHAWLQNEGTVLNDLHDHVRKFTPILVV